VEQLLFAPLNAAEICLSVCNATRTSNSSLQGHETKRLSEATRKIKDIMEPHWESKQIQIPENYMRLFFSCLKQQKVLATSTQVLH